MTHPYTRLLEDRGIRTFWGGVALSAVGSELYAFGAIWLAVSIAGADGSFLATARFTAILVMSLAAGAFFDLMPRRALLIGADLVRAAFSLIVVVVAVVDGLTLPLLILVSTVLSAAGAVYQPALQSGLPSLANDPGRLRETNGLFDATARTAQVAGPFLAAALTSVLPVIHLLTINAASYLASAGAVAHMGRRLEGTTGSAPPAPVWQRLSRGVRAAGNCPGSWRILLTTGVRAGAYVLGFVISVPLYFAEAPESGLDGATSVALVLGATAAGEVLSNLKIVTMQLRDPWRFMFLGYAGIGAGLALIAAAQALLPPLHQFPVLIALGFALGVGGSMAGIQMQTFFGSRMDAGDFAAVLRLRLMLVTGAAVASTALGPWLFGAFGIPATIGACGVTLLAAAMPGVLSKDPGGS